MAGIRFGIKWYTPAVGLTLFYIQMIIGRQWDLLQSVIGYLEFGIVQINEEKQLTSAVVGPFQKIIEVWVKLIKLYSYIL